MDHRAGRGRVDSGRRGLRRSVRCVAGPGGVGAQVRSELAEPSDLDERATKRDNAIAGERLGTLGLLGAALVLAGTTWGRRAADRTAC